MASLIIFVKNPALGKVKTRLAASIGDKKALKIYNQLVQHTQKITADVEADKFVYYSEKVEDNDLWVKENYTKKTQSGADLGERMLHAFTEIYKINKSPICIIGSDCFEVTTDILHQSFKELAMNDIVIGPSKDGGYYLLGMNEVHPELFENVSWSTELVKTQTLSIANTLNLSVSLLPMLNDIDTLEDLKNSPYPKADNFKKIN